MRKKLVFLTLFLSCQSGYANPPDNTFIACDEQSINCLALEKNKNWDENPSRYIQYYYTNDSGSHWYSSKIESPTLPGYAWNFDFFVCSKNAMHCVAIGWYALSKHGYGTYFSLATNNRGMSWVDTLIPTPDNCGHIYPDAGEYIDKVTCNQSGLSCEALGRCAQLSTGNDWWRKFSSTSSDGGIHWTKGVFI